MSPRFPAVYLGDGRVLLQTTEGLKMIANSRDVHVTPHLIVDGHWEPEISMLLTALVKPGMNCVDAGAHSGYFTLLMKKYCGAEGKVFSFEPNPVQASFICDSLMLNGFQLGRDVALHSMALSDKEETLRLGFPVRHTGGGGANIHEDSCVGLFDDVVMADVKADALDKLVAGNVDVIKIDCEGSEFKILSGATRILNNPDIKVVMEWSPTWQSPAISAGELFDKVVVENGFIASKIELGGRFSPFTRDHALQIHHCDLLLLRQKL